MDFDSYIKAIQYTLHVGIVILIEVKVFSIPNLLADCFKFFFRIVKYMLFMFFHVSVRKFQIPNSTVRHCIQNSDTISSMFYRMTYFFNLYALLHFRHTCCCFLSLLKNETLISSMNKTLFQYCAVCFLML